MTVPILELADAITADLNAADLGFTAQRDYLPIVDRESLTPNFQVFVTGKAENGTNISRTHTQNDRQVDIGVIKKLSRGSDNSFDRDELDDCMELVQAIKDRLTRTKFAQHTWIGDENDPLYNPEHLETHRQFTSVVTVTYRRVET